MCGSDCGGGNGSGGDRNNGSGGDRSNGSGGDRSNGGGSGGLCYRDIRRCLRRARL